MLWHGVFVSVNDWCYHGKSSTILAFQFHVDESSHAILPNGCYISHVVQYSEVISQVRIYPSLVSSLPRADTTSSHLYHTSCIFETLLPPFPLYHLSSDVRIPLHYSLVLATVDTISNTPPLKWYRNKVSMFTSHLSAPSTNVTSNIPYQLHHSASLATQTKFTSKRWMASDSLS